MIENLREFLIRPEAQGRFELSFGPGGAWGKCFDQAVGFRGTTLLRDRQNPRRFLLVEIWDSAAEREQAYQQGGEPLTRLDALFAEMREEERDLGSFSIVAEATVRPPLRKAPRGRR